MTPFVEVELELERLKAQARSLRTRAIDLELEADRLKLTVAQLKQDNLPTSPCNPLPPPPALHVDVDDSDFVD
jgi:hypothetical protein